MSLPTCIPRPDEIQMLIRASADVYGYDFVDYAEASFARRIEAWMHSRDFSNVPAATQALVRDPAVFESFLEGVTVNVTEMFRDPQVFRALREQVVPYLKTYPFVWIWNAGCATGEEAYSMAILLREEGLAGRFRIYATDINQAVLEKARKGIYPIKQMQLYTKNYQQSGGQRPFSEYYTACYDHALLDPSLREDVVFASHNLAADSVFGEVHLVMCRNVLIYFKLPLKNRALDLFTESLVPGGYLCLGTKEALDGRAAGPNYVELTPRTRIYRKHHG